jgi:RNA polymerase sigma-70 factor (ECF subfamily)
VARATSLTIIIATLEGALLMSRVTRDVAMLHGLALGLKRFVGMRARGGCAVAIEERRAVVTGCGEERIAVSEAGQDRPAPAPPTWWMGGEDDSMETIGTGTGGGADALGETEGSPLDRTARRAQFEREAMVHLDALYGFALRLARARDDAEDLVSDTVLRAFERWEQYRLGTNIRAWLFTILYHAFVSRKRRIDAREVPSTDGGDGWSRHEVVGEVDPERRFFDSFLDDEITRAIAALPDEYRSAVVLSDLHDLRYAEIARILRIPEGTVKSRLFRGRRILQRKLAGYAVDMGYFHQLPQTG